MSVGEPTPRRARRPTFEIAVLAENPDVPGMPSNILGTRAKFDNERELEELLPELVRAFRRVRRADTGLS